jgi:hypothetical protein
VTRAHPGYSRWFKSIPAKGVTLMNTQWLLGWWNLIFIVPFFLALVYLGVYTLTGVTFGDADHDADLDADHDVDADVDADADADIDADADVDADADTDIDADTDADADSDADADPEAEGGAAETAVGGRAPLVTGLLSAFGVGRVPLSILVTVLLFTWGAAGFITNVAVQARVGEAWRATLVSVPLALVAGLLMSRLVSEVICRFMPLNETSARRRHELLGLAGEALYPIGGQFGLAAVRDAEGNLFQVPCRVAPGAADIAKGGRVLLVAYNARKQIYDVVPRDPAVSAGAGATTTKAG